jgi:regulator of PEP synthase PpsR (kinase-PPPase family)
MAHGDPRGAGGRARSPRHVVIASDGTGRTAETVVRAALVQFRGAEVEVHVRPHVRTAAEVRRAVRAAAERCALVVYTLVSADLRHLLLTEARAQEVETIDLLGPLLLRLEALLQLPPLSRPGLFREMDAEYRHRFAVMEYTVRHDDGQDPHGLPDADIVLVGVSRTSKTPVSMFLAWRGLRVANVPIVHPLPMPEELQRVDARKVAGLTITADRLLELRRSRLSQMDTPPSFPYADVRQICTELEYAQRLCGRSGWPMVNVTDKSVEEVAGEVLLLTGHEHRARPPAPSATRPPAWRRTSE